MEEKEALGEHKAITDFFSDRLKLDPESTTELLNSYPRLYKCRVRRVSRKQVMYTSLKENWEKNVCFAVR